MAQAHLVLALLLVVFIRLFLVVAGSAGGGGGDARSSNGGRRVWWSRSLHGFGCGGVSSSTAKSSPEKRRCQ